MTWYLTLAICGKTSLEQKSKAQVFAAVCVSESSAWVPLPLGKELWAMRTPSIERPCNCQAACQKGPINHERRRIAGEVTLSGSAFPALSGGAGWW